MPCLRLQLIWEMQFLGQGYYFSEQACPGEKVVNE